MRVYDFLYKSLIVLLLIGCNPVEPQPIIPDDESVDKTIIHEDEYITVWKKWDEESLTTYILSRVKHKDDKGKLLQLKLATTVVDSGETVPQFAKRLNNPIIAINASTVLSNDPPWPKVSTGIVIKDGEILQNRAIGSARYVLGVKADNELVAYNQRTTAQQMVEDGVLNAITAFTPLIQNGEQVGYGVISLVDNQVIPNPRQVIAQFENNDVLILSCGGRGYDGAGMTMLDVIRVLTNLDDKIKFAYNLDGGGSTTTVLYGKLLTKMIDRGGKENRTRTNCLYVEPN